MSLRTRLFIGLGALVALLVLVQWWWVGSLTRELEDRLDRITLEVGSSVAALFVEHDHEPLGSADRRFVREEIRDADGELTLVLRAESEDGKRKIGWRFSTRDDGTSADGNQLHVIPIDGEGLAAEPGATIHIERRESFAWASVTDGDGTTTVQDVVVIDQRGDGEQEVTTVAVAPDARWTDRAESSTTATETGASTAPSRVHTTTELIVDPLGDEVAESSRVLSLSGPNVAGRVPLPETASLTDAVDVFSRRLFWGSMALLAAGLLVAGVIAHRATVPLTRLASAADRVGAGALGTRVSTSKDRSGNDRSGRDRSEVGRAIQAFNRMSGRLEKLDAENRALLEDRQLAELGEVARGLAHSLRNPANALGLAVDELASRVDDDDAHAVALGARQQIRRIDEAVRSFLALASQGGDLAPVDIAELVEDVALEVLQDCRGRIHVEVHCDDQPLVLDAIQPELRSVIQALVVNAAEASPDDGEVTIGALRGTGPDRVLIEVADRGSGIPESVRERLFTPHLTTKESGAGMGLFLAHRIASGRYRGDLTLEPRDGGGTLARLEIGSRVATTHQVDPGADHG
ncbi:MAG: HAMP domain-containing sensor histidine kinase [Acidobacteriota bacterium]